jgi:hypothetical protein
MVCYPVYSPVGDLHCLHSRFFMGLLHPWAPIWRNSEERLGSVMDSCMLPS